MSKGSTTRVTANQTQKADVPKLTVEQANRLWEHGMHEDNNLNNRLNFFLTLESVLLGLVAILFGQSPSNPNFIIVLRIFLGMGLFITIIWAYVAARQKYVFDSLRQYVRENMSEYDSILKVRERKSWPLSNNSLLSYVLPASFIIIWIILQFIV